jgi:TRAP-type transport system small permease protein
MKKQPQDRFERYHHWLVRAEQVLSAGLLVTVLGLIAAQVVARYVFDRPITWSEELARFAFIWLVFTAAVFVMAESRHIAVDVVGTVVGRRGRVVLEIIASLVVVLSVALLLWQGAPFAWGMSRQSPALGIAMRWWYLAAVVGLVLLALHAVAGAVRDWLPGVVGR